jgi:hypothetical protein
LLRRALIQAAVVAVGATAAPAETYVVDATQAYPGSFATIQEGLDAASDGDIVLVKPGSYSGEGNRDLSFGPKNLRLIGEDGPAATIIDGESVAGHRAFNFQGTHQDTTCIIEGFTIRRFRLADTSPGAAVRVEDTTCPKFVDLVIEDNTAAYTGGGMYVNIGSDPVLAGVTFRTNEAGGAGGGLYCATSSPRLRDCLFLENAAQAHGGGLYVSIGSSPVFWRTRFEGNATNGDGGGAYVFRASPSFALCAFIGNSASEGGGACSSGPSMGVFLRCTFAMNAASGGSAVRLLNQSDFNLTQCVIALHAAPDDGPVFCDGTSQPYFRHTCSYGNGGGNVPCGTVDGIIHEDARFCHALAGDFTVAQGSPCLPGHNPWIMEALGAYGLGCSQPAVARRSWGAIKALYLSPRRP